MRGLNIRSKYALAIVGMLVDSEEAGPMLLEARTDAAALGRLDYASGIGEPPIMLANIADLVDAWAEGWCAAAELSEMHRCDGCNNDAGEPCRQHG